MAYLNKPKPKPRNYSTDSRANRKTTYADSRWKQLRLDKLRDNPVCEVCGKELATAVHHIESPWEAHITPQESEYRKYDYNNLLSVSTRCHALVHGGYYTVFAYRDGTKEIRQIKPLPMDILEQCSIT